MAEVVTIPFTTELMLFSGISLVIYTFLCYCFFSVLYFSFTYCSPSSSLVGLEWRGLPSSSTGFNLSPCLGGILLISKSFMEVTF